MLLLRSLGVFAVTTLVFACSDDPAPMETPDAAVPDAAAPAPDAAAAAPTISISFDPATVTAGSAATLNATFTDFTLVDPRTGPPVAPNEGHFHVYVNENPNYIALWEASSELTTTPQDPPGTYAFRAVLVGSHHFELDPVVEASTTLTITEP